MPNKILFTSFYKDKNAVRQAELEECIKHNIANTYIDAMVVILEGKKEDFPILHSPKIAVIERARPTFQDFFDIVNTCILEDDIAIVANTDIYFDHSLINLDKIMRPNVALALTRYNIEKDNTIKIHAEHTWSQDVWVFKGRIRKMYAQFYMGIRGCDNRITWEIQNAGYQTINPSKNIRCIHNHRSEVRNYGIEAVDKPYCGVPWVDIFNEPIPEYRINGK